MCDIHYIMDLLDWNNEYDLQQKGVQLAKKVDNLEIFFQPCDERHNKNIWDNCAKIISSKSDAELSPYIVLMFEWLQDMNWPGAFVIRERLINMDLPLIKQPFLQCLNNAIMNDEVWKMWLMSFAKEYQKKQSGDGSLIDGGTVGTQGEG